MLRLDFLLRVYLGFVFRAFVHVNEVTFCHSLPSIGPGADPGV